MFGFARKSSLKFSGFDLSRSLISSCFSLEKKFSKLPWIFSIFGMGFFESTGYIKVDGSFGPEIF